MQLTISNLDLAYTIDTYGMFNGDGAAEEEAIQDKIYADCENYQIDQYVYDSGNGYYGAKDIDRQTKRAYVLQINEYAEGVTV